jgi:hypothetical protein
MPFHKARYPATWPEIARGVKEKAGWRCEECGIAQGALRTNIRGQYFREVLTCAHLGTPFPDGRPADKYDTMDCRPENLACLCTACHLLYDMADHVAARRETLRQKKRDALLSLYGSEQPLFEERKEPV